MIRNDCIADIEATIKNLADTKGYSEFDIIDCMAHVIQKRADVKQSTLFSTTKRRVTKKVDIPDKAIELANLFSKLCTARKKPIKPINVAAGARELIKMYEVLQDWSKIEWAIRYSQDINNCADQYMPVIYSFAALREKYEKLVNHKNRKDNEKKNEAFNKSQQSYVKPIRKVVYWNGSQFCTYDETTSTCPFKPNVDLSDFKVMDEISKKYYFGLMSKEEADEERRKVKETIRSIKRQLAEESID